MYATISFSVTLLGIFSIFELSKGNQKFSLLKYYILARLIIITAGSGLDYLGFSGYALPLYKEIFKITALLVTVNLFFLVVQKRIPKQVIWVEIFFITFFIIELIFGIETPIIKQGVLQNKPILFHQIFYGLYALLGAAALFYNTYYLFVAKKTQVNLYELKIKKWVGFYILSNIILVLISIFLFRSFQNGTLGVYDNTMITVFIHRFLFIFFILIRPKFLDDDKFARPFNQILTKNTKADGVGAGFKNTSIIIAVQSGTYSPTYDGASFAAAVCNEYTVTIDGVTYGDWYLPSKHELNLLFLQRAIVGNFPNISGSYWSSTEYFRSDLVGSYQLAWYQNFVTGAQAYLNKKNTWSVRAIRAF
jgi:hypothetical protein